MNLQENRIPIHDRDVRLAREILKTPLNLLISPNNELVALALAIVPQSVCIIPNSNINFDNTINNNEEIENIFSTVKKFNKIGTKVMLLVDADISQIDFALRANVYGVMINTNPIISSNFFEFSSNETINNLKNVAKYAFQHRLIVGAVGGLDYNNVSTIATIPEISILEIGHSIIARALFCGINEAVKTMKATISTARSNN